MQQINYFFQGIIITIIVAVFSFGCLHYTLAAEVTTETAQAVSYDFGTPTEPALDVDRISRLSEKYIMNTITAAELAELTTLKKGDFTDIEPYKKNFEAESATVTEEPAPEKETTAGAKIATEPPRVESAAPVASENPLQNSLLQILVLVNTVVVLWLIVRTSRRHNGATTLTE